MGCGVAPTLRFAGNTDHRCRLTFAQSCVAVYAEVASDSYASGAPMLLDACAAMTDPALPA